MFVPPPADCPVRSRPGRHRLEMDRIGWLAGSLLFPEILGFSQPGPSVFHVKYPGQKLRFLYTVHHAVVTDQQPDRIEIRVQNNRRLLLPILLGFNELS